MQLTYKFLLFLVPVCFSCIDSIAQKKRPGEPKIVLPPATPIKLEKELNVFNDGNSNAFYRISICADVPNNKNPMDVYYKSEPGHVFLILQKISSPDTVSKVFGFYPLLDMPVFFTNVRSVIKDNSKREYDVEISKMLTAEQFHKAVSLAIQYSKRKYHLTRFNCYDYTIEIFNAVAGDTLPFTRVKFPLWYGKGGSPCGFYKYMKGQKDAASAIAPYISFGNMVAPASNRLIVASGN